MEEIIFEQRGGVGLVTLNRPKVLNALSADMIVALRHMLDIWAEDDSVGSVVLRAGGDRAFCAGGDIRAFYESAKAGTAQTRAFWRDEYSLMAAIKRYPKTYISLIHGICMGGGMGISINGAYRLASENVVCAMPETGIGFYPDVGASFFLPRCPGDTGMYLALTGAQAKISDALYLGFVTHTLAQHKWPDLIDALASGEEIGDLLRSAQQAARAHAATAPISKHRKLIDAAFSAPSVEEILDRLDRDGSTFAQETAAQMRHRSPTALKIAFRAQRLGRKQSFEDSMRMEYRLSANIQRVPDFCEGIRAKIIDKDGNPSWTPKTLGQVAETTLEACFGAPVDGDLEL